MSEECECYWDGRGKMGDSKSRNRARGDGSNLVGYITWVAKVWKNLLRSYC